MIRVGPSPADADTEPDAAAASVTRADCGARAVDAARKIWKELRRQGIEVARYTVERLMRRWAAGTGVTSHRTTRPAAATGWPRELVKRDFTAVRPHQLWVADVTYVRTVVGWAYARSCWTCAPA